MTLERQGVHPVVGAAGAAESALEAVRDVQPVFMSTEDKTAALAALRRLQARAAELELRVVAAVSGGEVEEAGFRDVTGPVGWQGAAAVTGARLEPGWAWPRRWTGAGRWWRRGWLPVRSVWRRRR